MTYTYAVYDVFFHFIFKNFMGIKIKYNTLTKMQSGVVC